MEKRQLGASAAQHFRGKVGEYGVVHRRRPHCLLVQMMRCTLRWALRQQSQLPLLFLLAQCAHNAKNCSARADIRIHFRH